MGLGAVLLQRREVGGGGFYGGDGADLDELAAAVGDDARELGANIGGADVGLREPTQSRPTALEACGVRTRAVSLFCAFRAAVGIEDGVAGGLGRGGTWGRSAGRMWWG